jgi:transposase
LVDGYAVDLLATYSVLVELPVRGGDRPGPPARGFEVLPRSWVVERTFAWLGRYRRLAKDFEKTIASAEAWILVASIHMLTPRIARL